MAKLRLKQSDISDSNLYQLSVLNCYPAIEWLIYRNNKYSGLKKQNIQKALKKIRTLYTNNGVNYDFNKYSFDNLSKNSLFKWHPFLFELPIKSLVHPLNGNGLNMKILTSSKAKMKLNELITPINFKKVKLHHDHVSVSDLNKLCSSLVILNWEFKKSSRERPNRNFLNYYVQEDLLDEHLSSEKLIAHLDHFSLNKSQIRFALKFVSRELIFFVNSLSNSSLESLRRLFFIAVDNRRTETDVEILKLTPSYCLLHENSMENIILLEKLALLGYKKISHLQFLEKDLLNCLLDKNFSKKLEKIVEII